jgi:hypothetical protein
MPRGHLVIASVPAKIRTPPLTNTNIERYRCTNPPSGEGGVLSLKQYFPFLVIRGAHGAQFAVVLKLEKRGLRGAQHSIGKT